MADYTIVNGKLIQLVNVNAGGIDVSPMSYKDGVTLTAAELAAVASLQGVAVTKSAATQGLKRVMAGASLRQSSESDDPLYFGPGVGWWGADDSGYSGAQLFSAVEAGAWRVVNDSGHPNEYAAELKVVYKIATECTRESGGLTNYDKDLCKSFVNTDQMDANPAWIAKHPVSGANLHNFFGDHDGYVPDFGHSGFQDCTVENWVGFMDRNGQFALYIDNVLLYATNGYDPGIPVYEAVIPAGYDETTWKAACLEWVDVFCEGVRSSYPDAYIAMSVSDKARGAETLSDDYDGTVRVRAWGEVAALAHKPDAMFWEYWLQLNSAPRSGWYTGETAYQDRWDSNQSRVADAHALGFDIWGYNVFNSVAGSGGTADIGPYVRFSLLLDQDMSRQDTYWISNDYDGTKPIPDADLAWDPGVALDVRQQTGELHWRQFTNGTVIVNPTLGSETETILGVSRTVGARKGLRV